MLSYYLAITFPASVIAKECRLQKGCQFLLLKSRKQNVYWAYTCRVSEMLEVMEKADRLHVEDSLERSVPASTSGKQGLVEFNEVWQLHVAH